MNTPAQPAAGDVAAERRQTLEELYRAFNARDAEMFLAHMAPGVDWPNETTGGHVVGRAALRAHLEKEWRQGDPRIEPLQIDVDGEGARVRVDQLVRGLDGKVLLNRQAEHVYVFDGPFITRMTIIVLDDDDDDDDEEDDA